MLLGQTRQAVPCWHRSTLAGPSRNELGIITVVVAKESVIHSHLAVAIKVRAGIPLLVPSFEAARAHQLSGHQFILSQSS